MHWTTWTKRALASLACGLMAMAASAAEFAEGFESPPGTILNGRGEAAALIALFRCGPHGVP